MQSAIWGLVDARAPCHQGGGVSGRFHHTARILEKAADCIRPRVLIDAPERGFIMFAVKDESP